MPRPRHPKPKTQQVVREGSPGHGCPGQGRRDNRLKLPQLQVARGARRIGDSGSSRSGTDKWLPSWDDEASPRLGVGSPRSSVRLPPLPPNATVAQRAARNREVLRSVLLPPLRQARQRPKAPERPAFEPCTEPQADTLGAVLGELLPPKFRQFLQRLHQLASEPSPPPTRRAAHPDFLRQRVVPDNFGCPCHCSCSFLPGFRDHSPPLRTRFPKILLHPSPTLCPVKEKFTTVKKTPSPHCPQVPPFKAAISQSSSSGQSAGSGRRGRPFRVRFADETLGDSALRYWERRCAARQNLSGRTPTVLEEQLLKSLAKWLESLSRAQGSEVQEAARASGPCRWSSQKLSEAAHMNRSSQPAPRAAAHSPLGNPQTPPRIHRLLDPLDKMPHYWSRNLETFLPSLVLNTILK
ncbi:uncharacterized protein C9orf50 homolog [Suncus etruscus]|uniref:uncharacterized protein C9orf50 homolog n=1 Tax=Suncus etruscus TaxID=109475 RepID=UPI0021108703|nr:uncharacterized protein C9orf50 homolog [Suncus etruscus]